MNISLAKLPWYAQVGAFVAIGLATCGVFYYYYEMPVRAEMASREGQFASLKADILKGQATARKLPEFRAQVTDLEGRLANLKSAITVELEGTYHNLAIFFDRVGRFTRIVNIAGLDATPHATAS